VKIGPVLLLAIAALCLAFAIADQMSSGNVYGKGSSLRTDREGASAYFEALANTRTGVSRNYAPLDSLDVRNAGIMLLGVPPQEFGNPEFIDSVTALAKAGNRILIAVDGSVSEVQKPGGWELAVRAVANENADDDEDDTAWPVYFEPSSRWRVTRSLQDHAVVVERAFGAGGIALVASTRPFLNLALRDARDIDLLQWGLGDNPTIVFDESHLGSTQSGTIMGLVRRLRLQGFVAALVVASLLFFWRSSVPFPPVEVTQSFTLPELRGMTSAEAIRNLLERRIPPPALIPACVSEWARDFGRRAGPEAVAKAAEAAAAKEPPAQQWNKIRGIIRGEKS
jgi:hypothetical protein